MDRKKVVMLMSGRGGRTKGQGADSLLSKNSVDAIIRFPELRMES